jgi:hypothetical protein
MVARNTSLLEVVAIQLKLSPLQAVEACYGDTITTRTKNIDQLILSTTAPI